MSHQKIISDKKTMNWIYGCGALIVVLGIIFKINHWPGAVTLLIAGMSSELFIFLVSLDAWYGSQKNNPSKENI